MLPHLARQVFRQRPPRRFRSHIGNRGDDRRRLPRSGVLCLVRLQLLQLQLQLLDLPIQLLGLAAELHPPQLGDQQLQVLDLVVPRQQLFMLREDECFQFVGIECCEIRKSARSGNDCPEDSRLSLQQNENARENKK